MSISRAGGEYGPGPKTRFGIFFLIFLAGVFAKDKEGAGLGNNQIKKI